MGALAWLTHHLQFNPHSGRHSASRNLAASSVYPSRFPPAPSCHQCMPFATVQALHQVTTTLQFSHGRGSAAMQRVHSQDKQKLVSMSEGATKERGCSMQLPSEFERNLEVGFTNGLILTGHRSSGRVKQQSLEEEWFDEHSTWDAEMKPSVLDQASTHHAQVPVIAEDDMPCVVDNSPMESSHAALTGNLRSIVASSAAQGSGTDTSERAAASEQAIASLQAEASDTDLATQTDMVHVKAMEHIPETFSASKEVWQTQCADKQQGVDNKDCQLQWLSTALRATDEELASTKSHFKILRSDKERLTVQCSAAEALLATTRAENLTLQAALSDATSQTLAMRASQMDLVSQLERQQGRRHALQHLLGESERKLMKSQGSSSIGSCSDASAQTDGAAYASQACTGVGIVAGATYPASIQVHKHTHTPNSPSTSGDDSAPSRVLKSMSVLNPPGADEVTHVQPGSASKNAGDDAQQSAVRSWAETVEAKYHLLLRRWHERNECQEQMWVYAQEKYRAFHTVLDQLEAQNGALQTQNGSLQAQNGMLQIQIGGLRTRLLDCEARLRRAPIPAELKRLVREDVNRVMRDPNLGCGTRSHTVRALLQGWHADKNTKKLKEVCEWVSRCLIEEMHQARRLEM